MTTLEHTHGTPLLGVDGAASARRWMRLGAAALPRRRGALVRRTLLLADVAAIVASFLTSALVAASADAVEYAADMRLLALMLPICVVAAKLHGLYDRDEERLDHSTFDDLVGVFHVVTVGVWISVLVARFTGLSDPGFVQLTIFWALAVASITAGRGAARAACRRSPGYVQNTIIVGAGEIGQLVARKLQKHPEYGLNVIGFVDSEPKPRRGDLESLTVLGSQGELRELIARFDVARVVVAFSNDSAEATRDIVRDLSDLHLHVDVVPRLFEVLGPKASVYTIEALPLVGLSPARMSTSSRLLKRALDVVGSALALTLAAPLMAYIAWRVRGDSRGPVFFRQTRLGQDMREFTVLKFRTMEVGTDQDAHRRYIRHVSGSGVATNGNGLFKLDRHDAITPFGRWLRATSLDELPQLINVLRGDMSLVGPRPCIPYETENFERHHFERFLVPAGITGLWQVAARANSTFGEALEMDVVYAHGWSLGLDLRLLLRTPFQLLRQRSATA